MIKSKIGENAGLVWSALQNGALAQKALKKATKLNTAKPSKTSYTIKKLKKKTRYCVRIRAYKKVGSKIYYGDWSNIKYVTIQ